MMRFVSQVIRYCKGKLYLLRIKTGLYSKEKLPEYDFDILTDKWTFVDPQVLWESASITAGADNDMMLSICIPMYNVEKSIITLLEQIEKQKTQYEFEVILVNDGSTDATAKLVSAFIDGKSRYRMISQKNGGLAAARNTAIENAKGRYLTFVDSDDEMCDNCLDPLISAAITQNADIVKGSYYLKRGTKLIYRGIVQGYAWGALFRADLFDRIRFPMGYWYEDMINSFLLVPLSRKTIELDVPVIYHNDVEGSLSKVQLGAKNYKPLEQLYLVISLTRAYKQLGLTDSRYLQKRLLAECGGLMVRRTANLENEIRKQVFLACHEILVENGFDPSTFLGKDRIMAKAIMDKDYAAWKMAGYIY